MSYERSNELGGGDQPFAGEFVPGDTKWRLISAVVLEEFPFVTLHTPLPLLRDSTGGKTSIPTYEI